MITIPKEMWFCFSDKADETFPLSYLCHKENNKDFEKRKSTGIHWAKVTNVWNPETKEYEYSGVKEKEFNNDPVDGFVIKSKETRWSTSNVVWRVQDPRGFTVEIYSGNFEAIVRSSVINKGVIEGNCVWGRESGKNILIPENTEEYERGVIGTSNSRAKSISIKKVPVGSTVVLKGKEGQWVFCGEAYEISYSIGRSVWRQKTDEPVIYSSHKAYKFVQIKGDSVLFVSLAAPKVIEICGEELLTIDELVTTMLKISFSSYRTITWFHILGMTNNRETELKYLESLGVTYNNKEFFYTPKEND